ncbi:hypothetical protein CVT26_007233 [Gymnopilus dilepis]|uniref:Uncharacterized protein n=1 Tax=Gymnopilus dilepis TaxID=231916 RepID=A0A409VMF3_9AGAR|nr:hypothetical protein CVT26_007233 [Gymnopilus dilepis]
MEDLARLAKRQEVPVTAMPDSNDDDGFNMTWHGKTVHVDVSAIQGPLSFSIAPLLKASTAVEDEVFDCEADGPMQPLPGSSAHPASVNVAASKSDHQACIPVKRTKQSSNNRRRKYRRLEKGAQAGYTPRVDVFRRFVLQSIPTPTNLDFATLPVNNGAYSAGTFKIPNSDRLVTVEEALKLGLTYVPWKGIDSKPYFDSEGRLVCVAAGRPDDARFLAAADAVFEHLAVAGKAAAFRKSHVEHPRGAFPAVNVGITHGQGTQRPVNLQTHELKGVVEELLADENVQRLATFGSACFALWAPHVYGYYKEHLDKLFERMPDLRRIFPKSVFPTAAFNFGPNVWTFKHRDVKNCPFGFCAIQSLGRFDPTKGGHLILWELGLIIEFPPGSLILIPSATITHSNVPVAEGEERASFTQYAAGGLFRFVDYGFCTEIDLKERDYDRYIKMREAKPDRWQAGLDLLTKLQDLWPDRD